MSDELEVIRYTGCDDSSRECEMLQWNAGREAALVTRYESVGEEEGG